MKIPRRLQCCKCTAAEFAKILGCNSGYVAYLKNLGIVTAVEGKVRFCQSLRDYFLSYLPPWLLEDNVADLIERLSTPPNFPTRGLAGCWLLKKKIHWQELRLRALEIVNTFHNCRAQIAASRAALDNLRDAFIVERELIRRKICRAGLPAQIELVMLARYVDCLEWQNITFYSERHNYRLHRRGLNLMSGF